MSSSHFIYAIAHFCNISMAEFHPLYISLLVSDRVDALERSPKRSLHLTACITELQLDFFPHSSGISLLASLHSSLFAFPNNFLRACPCADVGSCLLLWPSMALLPFVGLLCRVCSIWYVEWAAACGDS